MSITTPTVPAGSFYRVPCALVLEDEPVGQDSQLRWESFPGTIEEVYALTTYREIETSSLVKSRYPLLADAASKVADLQVRNRGTIGGSLAHSDPAGHRGDSTSLVVSRHGDGGYLANAARAWGYGIIRGSSTRGGQEAFRQMLRILRDGGEIAITPDGPRGPARVVKGGVVAAAQLAGVSIIPVAVTVSSGWRLRSWDQFLIPKPFARVHIAYDDPLTLPESTQRAEGARLLQQRLDSLTAGAEC